MKRFCSLLVCVALLATCSLPALAIGGDPFDAFAVQYNPMTDEAVLEKLAAVPLAPKGGGVLPQLSGNTYAITNAQGVTIALTFDAQGAGVSVSAALLPPFSPPDTSPTELAFESEYAGLALGDFVLVGFREPETAKAWAVIWNLKSGLAAAYEIFFVDIPASVVEIFPGFEWPIPAIPAREAQRNVYRGSIGSSTQSPSPTNRLRGRAILWENDLGSFYTDYSTNAWSAFYPLGQPEGLAGSWTAPSDYLDFHDARHFLYSRTESVYSGATQVELLDLNLVTQIGLKIGFDATDTLAFTLYSGKGKILGSYATYSGFTTQEPAGNPDSRSGYRPGSENLEDETVRELMRTHQSWTGAFGGPGKEERMYPQTDKLDGKSFSLAFDDGLTLEYQVTGLYDEDKGGKVLNFREKGAQEWTTGRYEAFEVDANLIFFTHAIDDAFPDKIYLNVVDFDNGLATCMNSEILVDKANPRMCVPTFHFGVIDMAGITPVAQRHGFSESLLGTSFMWTYNDAVVSQHYYATPNSLYYGIMFNGEITLLWSCDAWYVKFRDNVFLISWLESFGPGQNDTKIFNLNTMHDAGVCYGIPDPDPGTTIHKFEYNTFGSEARHAGTVDVSAIYGKEDQVKVPDDDKGGSYTPGKGGGGIATLPPIGGGSVGSGSVGGPLTGFPDADKISPWAQRYMERLVESGVMSGRANGTLDPAGLVTRAEFTQMVVRGLKVQAGDAPKAFSDVGSGSWYREYVDIASSRGLVGGVSEAAFAPDRQISRQDLAVIVYRALETLGVPRPSPDGVFPDEAEISDYAKEAVKALKTAGIISGRVGGRFDPKATATREEAAKILSGVMDYVAGHPAA